MNPEASRLWRAPRWALSVLLACLAYFVGDVLA